jgi:sensor histidine kinase YesM
MAHSTFPEKLRPIITWLSIPFQIVVWLVYMSFPFLILSLTQVFSQSDVLNIFSLKLINDIISIAFFYVNLYLLTPYVLKKGKIGIFGLIFSGLLLVLFLLDSLYYQLYLSDVLTDITLRIPADLVSIGEVPFPIILISTLSLFLLTSVSSGLAIYRDRAQQMEAGQQMVIQKQDAELTALKLQISPHFLFNTLNNLRWLARQKSDATEDAILRLSEMMRYMIYQVEKGPVTLAKEIDYLEHYLELQKMRLTANHHLTFDILTDNRQVLIEPLLFVHFVENAFKHGVHAHEIAPIHISLTYQQGLLRFQTRNRILTNDVAPSDSGIGIQNIERRLALHYPTRHRLRIFEQNGFFCVDLHLELSSLPADLAPTLHETTQYRY